MFRVRTAVFALVALGFAGSARADIISDEEAQCRSAAEGDACTLGSTPGVCTKSTCSRNDYSDGPPPKTVTSDCFVCVAKPEGKADAKVADDKATLSTNETKTAGDSKTPSGESKPTTTTTKSGCASAAQGTGAWQLACIGLGLGLVALGRRRVRRSD
jgi:hypothetical protein